MPSYEGSHPLTAADVAWARAQRQEGHSDEDIGRELFCEARTLRAYLDRSEDEKALVMLRCFRKGSHANACAREAGLTALQGKAAIDAIYERRAPYDAPERLEFDAALDRWGVERCAEEYGVTLARIELWKQVYGFWGAASKPRKSKRFARDTIDLGPWPYDDKETA